MNWEGLGVREDGLPVHLPMGMNENNEGPEGDATAHHYACWCGDPSCELTKALGQARESGVRNSQRIHVL